MINISDKVVGKIKIHILYSTTSPPPQNRVIYEITWGKCSTAGQATDDSIKRRTRAACWVTNRYKRTLRICNNYCFLHGGNGYASARQCDVIRTLPVR